MQRKQIEGFIAALSDDKKAAYRTYMEELIPQTDEAVFRRFLFAFASVQTGWQANVALYQALYDLEWCNDQMALRERIQSVPAGLSNNREKYIWDLSNHFWSINGPEWYRRHHDESWQDYRDRMVDNIFGLGPAKVSFAVEMIYPEAAEVVCLDRHMLRMYKYCSTQEYKQYENHWVKHSLKSDVNPVVSRWMCWDHIQDQPDSRYWAYILEKGDTPKQTAGEIV
jgi:thermostable 8-oxoguanine DNA glycosylase